MSRAARGALTLLLPVISIAAVAAIFEVGLRLTDHVAIYEMYSKPSLFWRYDELLGWSHEPGASGEFVGPRPWPIEYRGRVAINSIGLRGPEIPPGEPSELRVLFSGDSMVAAFEVDENVTFVARTAGLLRERLGVPVRTINAGVRGYGTDQDYLYYRERGWRLEPDMVVFLHSANDPSDNTTLHEMRRPFGKPALSLSAAGTLDVVGVPVPRYPSCCEVLLSPDRRPMRTDTIVGRSLCNAQMMLFDHSALFSYLTLAVPWDNSFLSRLYYVGNPHTDQLERAVRTVGGATFEGHLTTAIILAYADEVQRRGASFMLIGARSHLDQLDLGALARAGIAPIDLTQIDRDGAQLRWHHDSHYNPEAHRRIAELLAPEIETRLRARISAPARSVTSPAP